MVHICHKGPGQTSCVGGFDLPGESRLLVKRTQQLSGFDGAWGVLLLSKTDYHWDTSSRVLVAMHVVESPGGWCESMSCPSGLL